MSEPGGKITVSYADLTVPTTVHEKDGVFIGRLDTCEVVLDHKSVSRIHAAINYKDGRYTVANVSSSNVMTLNGRQLAPQRNDVLADGDAIQIGPFTVFVARLGDELLLVVEKQVVGERIPDKPAVSADGQQALDNRGGVLDVFWEKRTREKEDWGSRLRPTEKPLPGKAMFNWRPTGDLRRPWKIGVFVWALIVVGAVAVFAYYKYPQTYAPKPLASPHVSKIDASAIAASPNGNSCTTCHMVDQPIENACITCHTAEQFHASNTKPHEQAGVTCTVCHKEHNGSDFQLTASAIQSCSQCHNDANKNTYNGNSVRTADGGSYGYPVENGIWKWKGVYREVAELIPEINSPATGDKDGQARLSRHFHSVHVARLAAPPSLAADKLGLVSCSTCHKSFTPIDRVTPRATCAACHTSGPDAASTDVRFAGGQANCISCHVQHPYSGTRWGEFLSEESLKRRNDAVLAEIEKLK